MQKDFKIGLFIGVSIAIAALIWLCTLPRLSTIARAMQSTSDKTQPAEPQQLTPQPVAQPTSTPEPQNQQLTQSVIPSEHSADPRMSLAGSKQLLDRQQGTHFSEKRFHVVQKGDSLSKISVKYYGSANQWQKIVAANHDTLPDPNRLSPGIRLIIP